MLLKLDTDGMNSFYSNCVDCGSKKLTDIDRKDLNCYLQKLTLKEKLCYDLLSDFYGRLSNLLKVIGYESLYVKKII